MLTALLLTVLVAQASPAGQPEGATLPSGTPAATTPATRDAPVDHKQIDNAPLPQNPDGTAGSNVLEPGKSPPEPDRDALPHIGGVRIVGVDSSEPDMDEGRIGRVHYPWIKQRFEGEAALKVFVLHHHLLPIPGTGRERSTVMDAGDLLEVLIHAGVDVVLSGHKHVPYVWRLEHMYVANAGTVSSMRVRGHGKPCYNVLEFADGQVRIVRRFPFEAEAHVMAAFPVATAKQHPREVSLLDVAERS